MRTVHHSRSARHSRERGNLLRSSSYLIFFLCLTFFLFFSTYVSAASLTTHLDRTEISDGESVNLIISVEGKSGEQPDLSPLDKDFAVISTSTRSSLQVINGESKATTTWVVGLIPKKMGEMTIPKIKVGNDFAQPVKLMVSTQPKQAIGSTDMFVEVDVEPKQAYVQQQLVYKLRLNVARSFMNVQFIPPQSDDAKIEPIGHDIRYMSTIGSKAYQVVEKHFLVFPQKSGKITLTAPLFMGEVVDEGSAITGAGSFFQGFHGFGSAVRVKGKKIVLDIKPKPQSFAGQWWLPAENIRLEENFSKNISTWEMGELLTRTIKITATGLLAQQLPNLEFADIENVNLYPDQPIAKNEVIDGKLVGKKEFRIAMMPNKNGEVVLPAIKLSWWNVKKNKTILSELPSHRYAIVGTVKEKNENNISMPIIKDEKTFRNYADYYLWALAVFLILSGWGFSVWLWCRTKKPAKSKKINLKKPRTPNAAIKLLFNWAKKRWPENPPVTLTEIARRLKNPKLEEHISLLEKLQYSNSDDMSWDADAFWTTFQNAIKQKQQSRSQPKDPIPDLF